MSLKPVYDPTEYACRKAQCDIRADYQQYLPAGISLVRRYVKESLEIECEKSPDSKGNEADNAENKE